VHRRTHGIAHLGVLGAQIEKRNVHSRVVHVTKTSRPYRVGRSLSTA
jgi:hypothetical protein